MFKKEDFNRVIVTAHRGASGLVEHENTIEAFQKAIELDVDSIECDVRKTKDGVIMVNHNADIEGLIIAEHTYEEICEATMKNGYKQPTLLEALNFVKGKMLIDIEIKEPGYEEELVNIITSVLTTDEFWIRSFFDETVQKFKEINPNITTVLLIGREHVKYGIFSRLDELFPYGRVKKTKCDYVSPNYQLLLLGYCNRMHRKNVKVLVWTVNDQPLMKKVLKKKADGLITNFPNLALPLVK